MKCPQCNTQNPDQARFCMSCGERLQAVPVEPAGAAPEPAAAQAGGRQSDLESVLQARQVNITQDASGNIIITGDNNTVSLAPDQAPALLLKLYYRSLAEECQRLPLGLLNEEYTRPGSSSQVSLTNVYTDLDVVSAPRAEGEEVKDRRWLGMRLEQGEGGERTPLLDALGQPQRRLTALIGAPGSGKSTFINYLVARLAAGTGEGLPEAFAGRLVVRLELRRVAAFIQPEAACGTPQMLWQALKADISRFWGEDTAGLLLPYLQRQLSLKGGWVLLDGLDEVPEAGRRRRCLLEAIHSWEQALPRCRFLLTARPYAYADPEWQLPAFDILALAPFNPNQVSGFVRQWYQAVRTSMTWDETTAAARAEELLRAFKVRPDLADLATRPLLLTLMATLHSHKSRMPENRADLYEFSAGLLLQRWQEGRQVKDDRGAWMVDLGIQQALGLGENRLRLALETLALQVQERQGSSQAGRQEGAQNVPADIPLGEVLEVFSLQAPADLNPRALVRYFDERAGLLVGREQGVYTFVHRSFQEYLAACRLANSERDFAGKLCQLVTADLDWWREVFLLGVGKQGMGGLSGSVDIVNRLLPADADDDQPVDDGQWRLAVLGAEAARDLRLQENAAGNAYFLVVLERLRGWLVRLLAGGHLPVRQRLQAGDLLGTLGDPRPGVNLVTSAPGKTQAAGEGLPDIDWVHVPEGEFRMGSEEDDPQAYEDEKTQHPLELPGFWISRYPLTNAQYALFVEQGYADERYWTPEGWAWRCGAEPDLSALESLRNKETVKRYRDWVLGRSQRSKPYWWGDPQWGTSNRPVVGVSWFEAAAYCRWLDESVRRAGLLPVEVPPAFRVRLPSEAEWEKAARGTDGRRWSWGDDWQEGRANTQEADLGETSPVGLFPDDDLPYGLLDMTGNTWEWTLSKWGMDVYQPDYAYPYRAEDGRQQPGGADWRVVRGGSWNSFEGVARCAFRYRSNPTNCNHALGFRVVLSLAIPGF